VVSFRMHDSDAGRRSERAPVLPTVRLLRCSRSWPWQSASAGSAALSGSRLACRAVKDLLAYLSVQ
jgi:hypothetical protein